MTHVKHFIGRFAQPFLGILLHRLLLLLLFFLCTITGAWGHFSSFLLVAVHQISLQQEATHMYLYTHTSANLPDLYHNNYHIMYCIYGLCDSDKAYTMILGLIITLTT